MPLSNSQYDAMIRNYEERQLHNRHLHTNRKEEVYRSIPEFEAIDNSIASISVQQGKKLIDGDESALSDLKLQLEELSTQKQSLLASPGYPADYLEPIYHCSDCQDTGYINNEKCHCFRQAIITMLYAQSNIQEVLLKENFSTLNSSYYEGDDLTRFQNAVKECHEFVSVFGKDYRNLFFYGTVGTGKSFLSGCIAKEVIEAGHPVLYFSSVQLFDILSAGTFDYKKKEDLYNLLDDLYNCDLLIIDDLGTETLKANVTSQLFSFLNERHIRKKPTIISTNLSLEETRNRYSDRIFSRIMSHYHVCKLTGPDIRMYKKRLINRK